MLDDAQRLAGLVDIQRNTVAGEVYLFQTLGNTHHGYASAQPHFVQSLHSRAELALAAINDNKLRQVFTLLHEPRVATCEDLFHRGKVIGADDGFNLKMSVVAFARTRIAEHDTGCHRVGTLDIRIVETFDMVRQHAQAEIRLNLFERAHDTLFGIMLGQVLEVVYTCLAGIAARHIQEFGAITALGHGKSHRRHLHVRHLGHHNLVIHHSEGRGNLVQGIRQQLPHPFVHIATVTECNRTHHSTATDMHIIDIHIVILIIDTKNIYLGDYLRYNNAATAILGNEVVLSLELLRLLEA